MRKEGVDLLTMGYAVYKVQPGNGEGEGGKVWH